jgi:hypothetical protein
MWQHQPALTHDAVAAAVCARPATMGKREPAQSGINTRGLDVDRVTITKHDAAAQPVGHERIDADLFHRHRELVRFGAAIAMPPADVSHFSHPSSRNGGSASTASSHGNPPPLSWHAHVACPSPSVHFAARERVANVLAASGDGCRIAC